MIDPIIGFIYPTMDMTFDSTALTLPELVSKCQAKINEAVQLVNDLTDAIATQSQQISAFDEGMTADMVTYKAETLAALEAWKSAFVVPAMVELATLHGWAAANGSKIQYWKDNSNMVHLRGKLAVGTTIPLTTILALPAGYRPAQATAFLLASDSNTPCILNMDTDGVLKVQAIAVTATYVWLDNFQFSLSV